MKRETMTRLVEIKALLKLMKKSNILSLKVGDIEIICSEHSNVSVKRKPIKETVKESIIKVDPNVSQNDLMDEELIYWSSDSPSFAKKRN